MGLPLQRFECPIDDGEITCTEDVWDMLDDLEAMQDEQPEHLVIFRFFKHGRI